MAVENRVSGHSTACDRIDFHTEARRRGGRERVGEDSCKSLVWAESYFLRISASPHLRVSVSLGDAKSREIAAFSCLMSVYSRRNLHGC